MNLYDVLGVHPAADQKEIRNAYRTLAKTMHPDAGGDAERFAHISRVYRILSDPILREQYDRTGQVNDGPNVDLSLIHNIIAQKLFEAINQIGGQVERFDVCEMVLKALASEKAKGEQQRTAIANEIAKLNETLSRLAHKGDTADVMGNILRKTVQDKEVAAAKLADSIKLVEQAIEWVEVYEYRVDPQPVQVFMTPTTSTSSATSTRGF